MQKEVFDLITLDEVNKLINCNHHEYNNKIQEEIIELALLLRKDNFDMVPDSSIFNNIKGIQKLQESKCEKIIRKCFEERSFIEYALNNADVISTKKCLNKFFYLAFRKLVYKYQTIRQVVKNKYTAVMGNKYGASRVDYLQVYENGVKYTIKMEIHIEKPGYCMNIRLKKTTMSRYKTYDKNYVSIDLFEI